MQKRGVANTWSRLSGPWERLLTPAESGAATMSPVVSGCAEQELLSYHIKLTGQVMFEPGNSGREKGQLESVAVDSDFLHGNFPIHIRTTSSCSPRGSCCFYCSCYFTC